MKRTIPYRPALDGLRGFALFGMLLFHGGFAQAEGGFLGLTIFFVLSGFLITTLLLTERHNNEHISLKRFWGRRFRRLMPAAFLALLGIIVFGATVAEPSQIARLRGDVFAALAYVANWRFIATGQEYTDYFAAPSPVLHFWSLGVEEQFYLFYPLLVTACLALVRGSRRLLTAVLLVLTAASAVHMAVVADGAASLSRPYYSTFTRLAEILVGALLAIYFMDRLPFRSERVRQTSQVAGAAALLVVLWSWTTIPWATSALYHGGYLLFALLSAVTVIACAQDRGFVVRVLSVTPVRLFGVISYGVYLFHWPVFLWLTPERTGLDGMALFTVRMAVTVGLATISYRFVESPIRSRERLVGRAALIAAPVALAGIIVLVTVVTADPPVDPLEELAEQMQIPGQATESLEPTLAGAGASRDRPRIDRPARILVVGDQGAEDLVPGLTRWGSIGRFEVTSVTGLPCGDPAHPIEVDGETLHTCEGWAREGSLALDGFDPDLVLLSVADWSIDDLLTGDESDLATSEQTEAVLARLDAAFALMGSRGAHVMAVGFPHAVGVDGQANVPSDVGALGDLVAQAAAGSEAVDVVIDPDELPTYPDTGASDPSLVDQWSDAVAGIIGPRVLDTVIASWADDVATRILIVGDSLATNVGTGIESWSEETGDALVYTAGVPGCGIARGGTVRTPVGEATPSELCELWPIRWKAHVEDFDPDVVVVFTGVWDVVDRRIDGWQGYLGIGDPAFDDYVLSEYRAAVDLLSSSGAKVLWIPTPCPSVREYPGRIPETPVADPERLALLTEQLIPRLVEAHPEVAVLDLSRKVCPDGDFSNELGGIDDARPDGLHFSVAAGDWVADWLGPEVVAAAAPR